MRLKPRKPRPIFFVCAGIDNQNELQTKSIQASSTEEAINLFTEQLGFKPKDVLGPWHKKQTQELVNLTKIIFSEVWRQAEYKGWNVNACILKEPANHAMILFKTRIDGQNIPKPQGTNFVVPIYDLRLTNA
jgi:hypothetical protein